MSTNALKPKYTTERLIEAIKCLSDLLPGDTITGIQFENSYGNNFNYQVAGSNWITEDLQMLLNLRTKLRSSEPIIEHIRFSKRNYPTIEASATFSDGTRKVMFTYHTDEVELYAAELTGLTAQEALDLYEAKQPVTKDKIISKF